MEWEKNMRSMLLYASNLSHYESIHAVYRAVIESASQKLMSPEQWVVFDAVVRSLAESLLLHKPKHISSDSIIDEITEFHFQLGDRFANLLERYLSH